MFQHCISDPSPSDDPKPWIALGSVLIGCVLVLLSVTLSMDRADALSAGLPLVDPAAILWGDPRS